MDNQTDKTIVVLGMHRSGTSVTAGILKILGVDMGLDTILPDRYNLKGYFEDAEIRTINDAILREAGGSWNNPPPLSNIQKIPEGQAVAIRAWMRQGLWGFKDPRTCLTIEALLPYLPQPHLVVCLRNLNDIVDSLVERDMISFAQAFSLAIFYLGAIEKTLSSHPDLPVIFVAYEKVINTPTLEVRRLAAFLGLPFSAEQEEAIKRFITPSSVIAAERAREQHDLEIALRQEIEELKRQKSIFEHSRGWKILSFFHAIRIKVPFLNKL